MLLTITTTHFPATDLGYLLHKNPARPQVVDLTFGRAQVFYSEASDDRCTAAMLIEIDPVGLVRKSGGPPGDRFALEQYVNDRPYAASSFLSVAITQVFGTALAGNSRERPELARTPIPLKATISVVPCRGGEPLLRRLFEPLGYAVETVHHPLDPVFPEWGDGPYFTVALTHTLPVYRLLEHLYVLVPVLDNDKHYWIGEEEVAKLMRHGEGWLADHPDKELIVDRYLKHRKHLTRTALEQLVAETAPAADEADAAGTAEEEQVEQKISLNEQRLNTVMAVLRESGAKSVLDLGCSYGNLMKLLAADKRFDRVVGLDVSARALEIVADKLHLDTAPDRVRDRVKLIHGSLTYRDNRLAGFDAAAVVEVIEHLDPPRLAAFERVLFEFARPSTVVVTTPNVEYNVRFETLPAGKLRHRDHRFEWTREQFRSWATTTAGRFGYAVRFVAVGPVDSGVGSPTQMGVFTLRADSHFISPRDGRGQVAV